MSSSTDSSSPYARLGADHGYLVDGDTARLHADVEFPDGVPPTGRWALQLWACDAPHAGGPLAGIKVAEADLLPGLDLAEGARRIGASTHALVPGGRRDYAMVLVLASGEEGRFDQVHDFANYPARQAFVTPHFDGRVGYRVEDGQVVLEAALVRSPRAHDNVSGTLSLELWAVAGTYRGGPVDGHALGRVELGRLAGQSSLEAVAERAPFSPPPAGSWQIVLMLREWAGPAAGYVTRDFAGFGIEYVVAEPDVTPAAPAPEAVAVLATAVDNLGSATLALNRSSVEELAGIKGLSRKVAAEIVKGRPYDSIDALIAVRGIGPKVLARLRTLLTLD